MSFLKKLGQVIASAASTAIGIGPLVMPLLGGGAKASGAVSTVTNDLTLIASVVAQVETMYAGMDGTGPQKFIKAVALVGPIIRTSQLVSGKKIADAALMQQGIEDITQGVVQVLNSLHPDSVSSEVVHS